MSLSYRTHYFSEYSGYDFAMFFGNEKPAKPYAMRVFYGAVKQIRTADLILTKDVLCHLSYNSLLNFGAKILPPTLPPTGMKRIEIA